MGRLFSSFVSGITLGAITVWMLRKYNIQDEQEKQVEYLANRITKQIRVLESKLISKVEK